MSKGLKLTDILITIVIAIVFAVIYRLWGPVSALVGLAGLQLDQLVYGMWFIAATVAFLIIRKPGVALLAEIAAASGELIMGSEYGMQAFTYGIAQGLGVELVLLLFGYRANLFVVSIAGLGAGLASLGMDWFRTMYPDLAGWSLTLLIVFRLVGAVVFTGVVAYYLVKALEATGVTKLVRPASKEDYSLLEK